MEVEPEHILASVAAWMSDSKTEINLGKLIMQYVEHDAFVKQQKHTKPAVVGSFVSKSPRIMYKFGVDRETGVAFVHEWCDFARDLSKVSMLCDEKWKDAPRKYCDTAKLVYSPGSNKIVFDRKQHSGEAYQGNYVSVVDACAIQHVQCRDVDDLVVLCKSFTGVKFRLFVHRKGVRPMTWLLDLRVAEGRVPFAMALSSCKKQFAFVPFLVDYASLIVGVVDDLDEKTAVSETSCEVQSMRYLSPPTSTPFPHTYYLVPSPTPKHYVLAMEHAGFCSVWVIRIPDIGSGSDLEVVGTYDIAAGADAEIVDCWHEGNAIKVLTQQRRDRTKWDVHQIDPVRK